jgi:N-acetylglucosamine-6-phosphate deacetylase
VFPDGVPTKTDLLVRDGKIASPTEAQATTGVNEIDLPGCTLFPGFIDVHVHGAVGVDAMEADAAGLCRVSEFLASKGVTAWLPTLVPAPDADYAHAIAAIDEAMKSSSGARILGVHYEGPFVNAAQCGALRQQYFRGFVDDSLFASLPRLANPAAVHMMTIAPEIEGGIELVHQLARRGWVVSIGHTHADFETLDKAFTAGARHMTHFMNAMAPFQQRAPGPIGWGLLRDDVTCDVIADGIHLDRHALELILKGKGAERVMLISDAIAAAGMGDGEYQIWGESISVTNDQTRNSRGSIAGSVISLLDAVHIVASLGFSEVALARFSSTNPAKLLGVDNECGSIAAGKRADVVALDAAKQPVLVMITGEVVLNITQR